jgi:hypothetical protein
MSARSCKVSRKRDRANIDEPTSNTEVWMRSSGWVRFAALGASVVLLLAACGDDDDDDTSTTTAGGTETTTAETGATDTTPATTDDSDVTDTTVEETTTTVAPVEAETVDVVMADYSFDTGGVTEVPAGAVTVTVSNEGAEEHQAAIVRLNDGVTLGDFAATADTDLGAALQLVTLHGGPNAIGPGGTGAATTALEAGDYAFICFIPSPSDDIPHAAKGMVASFTVTGEADPTVGDALLASSEGSVATSEFAFDIAPEFDGNGTFTIDNTGAEQVHEAVFYELTDGATVDDAVAALTADPPAGPPPIVPAGGVALVSPGTSTTFDLALAPGSYAVLCFIPDVETGAPHLALGMATQVDIT